MAKKPNSQDALEAIRAQLNSTQEKIAQLEADIEELRGKSLKDVAAVHRSLKEYKETNGALVEELRKRIEGIAQVLPRRRN